MTECFFTDPETLFQKGDVFPRNGMTDGERINTLIRCSIFIFFIIACFFNIMSAIIFLSASLITISLVFGKVEYIRTKKIDSTSCDEK